MIRTATMFDINYLVNHKGIAKGLGITDLLPVNMGNVFWHHRNVFFTSEVGGMWFEYAGNHVFDCHFLFIPGSGGKAIKTAAQAMLSEMFTNREARAIRGYPPRDNRAVRVMGTSLGFQKIDEPLITDDLGRECETYELRS